MRINRVYNLDKIVKKIMEILVITLKIKIGGKNDLSNT